MAEEKLNPLSGMGRPLSWDDTALHGFFRSLGVLSLGGRVDPLEIQDTVSPLP